MFQQGLASSSVSLNPSLTEVNSSSYISYWPGHVVAECLSEEPNSKETNFFSSNKNNSGSNLMKLSKKLSRTESTGSQNSSDINNNTDNSVGTNQSNRSNDSDIIKAAKLLTKLKPGSSFSAIISSMVPFEILTKFLQNENNRFKGLQNETEIDINEAFIYDEFGFQIENEVDPKLNDSQTFVDVSLNRITSMKQLNETPFIEDSKHKLKWIAYLEFTLNADIGHTFSWDEVTQINRCEKLKQMIRGQGIAHSLRKFMWMRLSGALDKKSRSQYRYNELCKSQAYDQYSASKQIEKDLLRTLPSNACFSSINSVGVPRLRRVLQAIAWLYPNIGYCQGMGPIAANLLLFIEEEDTFWLMSAIIEDILPASYYSHNLVGVQADIKVLNQLIDTYLPEISEQFRKHEIELSLICINWFLTVFSNVFHIKILLRVWDLFFYEGSVAIFQITLAMLKLNETAILSADNSSEIFTVLSELPSKIYDIDVLIEMSIRIASSVSKTQVDTIRQKHQAYLMAQNGAIINPSKYERILLNKERTRQMDRRAPSFISKLK